MDSSGWVSFHRKIAKWEWYQDANTFRLFFHLVLMANHEDGRYMGYDIPRGSIVVGQKALSLTLQISQMQVRTALDKLKSTQEITVKTTNRFSIITICKYEDYQSREGRNQHAKQHTDNTQITHKQHTDNTQITPNNKNKNKKNNKNARKKEDPPYPPKGPEDYFGLEVPRKLKTPDFHSAWLDFCDHRKEIKKKLTKKAVETTLKKLDSWGAAEAIESLRESISNGWQGVFPLKQNNINQKNYKTRAEKNEEVLDKTLDDLFGPDNTQNYNEIIDI